MLLALLEPPAIRAAALAGDTTARLALQEKNKSLPRGAARDFYSETKGVPVGAAWRPDVRKNGADVLLICKQSRAANKLADDSDSGKLCLRLCLAMRKGG